MDYFLEMYGGICLRGCHKEKVILRYDFGRLVLSTLNGVFLEVALCTCFCGLAMELGLTHQTVQVNVRQLGPSKLLLMV